MQAGYTMSNGKSDLHVHFHGNVAAGASLHVHVPSLDGVKKMIDDLREALLSRNLLTEDLSDAIRVLSTKIQTLDDVVLDAPVPLNPIRAE